MSSVAINPEPREPQQAEWARLIPGQAPSACEESQKLHLTGSRAFGKPIALETDDPVHNSSGAISLLTPAPLQSRRAGKRMRSLALDWALMALNWLVGGAALVWLHAAFSRPLWVERASHEPLSLLGIAVLHAALVTLVGHTEGLYEDTCTPRREALILTKSIVLATSVLCGAYMLQGEPWSRSALCCGVGVMHLGALWTWRWRSSRRDLVETRGVVRNVLIVGAGTVGRRLAAYLEQHPEGGRKLYGFLDDEKPIEGGVIGRVRDLARMARTGFVDEVFLAAPSDSKLTHRLLHEARRLHLDLEIVPDLCGCRSVGSAIEQVAGLPVICLHVERLPALPLVLKRMVDIAGASLAFVALSPLLAMIALLIKLDSPGPVFYCAQRAGRKGRRFRCYKFRTMVANADDWKMQLRKDNQRSGPFFKISADPRITRVGSLLRRYSLDELPQLWNVVRGEMSLVGPRPHPLDDVAGYEIEHLARLDVTPGMTGLWQVTARRDPSFQRGMELDRQYIRTWSLGLDIRILLRTFIAVWQGSGD